MTALWRHRSALRHRAATRQGRTGGWLRPGRGWRRRRARRRRCPGIESRRRSPTAGRWWLLVVPRLNGLSYWNFSSILLTATRWQILSNRCWKAISFEPSKNGFGVSSKKEWKNISQKFCLQKFAPLTRILTIILKFFFSKSNFDLKSNSYL